MQSRQPYAGCFWRLISWLSPVARPAWRRPWRTGLITRGRTSRLFLAATSIRNGSFAVSVLVRRSRHEKRPWAFRFVPGQGAIDPAVPAGDQRDDLAGPLVGAVAGSRDRYRVDLQPDAGSPGGSPGRRSCRFVRVPQPP